MIVGRFRSLAREIGLGNALLYLASRAMHDLSCGRVGIVKYYIVAQPVPPHDLTPPRRGRQIVVTEAAPAEAMSLTDDRPRAVLQARLDGGCRCLVARKDGNVVGFQWFTLQDYHEDEVRCIFRLAPEDHCAWDFDIFVPPQWRTQPVFSRLWDKCNELLRATGARHSLSRINAFNALSRRAHERIGAEVVGWAAFARAGTLQLSAFSARPWIHFGFRRTSVPVLTVSGMVHGTTRSRK